MAERNERAKGRGGESDILFSRSVKAGKRIYYLDVKCDRKGDYYISMTESKRVKEATVVAQPVFEKHKIFLFSEDLDKFVTAFREVAQYVRDNAPVRNFISDWSGPAQTSDASEEEDADDEDFKIEF